MTATRKQRIVDDEEAGTLGQLHRHGFDQRVGLVPVEDLLAGLEHELQELGLVVLGVMGQEHIGEEVGVALMELIEVVRGCVPVARSHTTEYRLLTHAPGP